MDVEKFSFNFYFRHKEFVALCCKFQVHKFPQIHVNVGKFPKDQVFNFYLLPDEIFWFELPETSEPFAKSIAAELSKKYNRRFPDRRGTSMK